MFTLCLGVFSNCRPEFPRFPSLGQQARAQMLLMVNITVCSGCCFNVQECGKFTMTPTYQTWVSRLLVCNSSVYMYCTWLNSLHLRYVYVYCRCTRYLNRPYMYISPVKYLLKDFFNDFDDAPSLYTVRKWFLRFEALWRNGYELVKDACESVSFCERGARDGRSGARLSFKAETRQWQANYRVWPEFQLQSAKVMLTRLRRKNRAWRQKGETRK